MTANEPQDTDARQAVVASRVKLHLEHFMNQKTNLENLVSQDLDNTVRLIERAAWPALTLLLLLSRFAAVCLSLIAGMLLKLSDGSLKPGREPEIVPDRVEMEKLSAILLLPRAGTTDLIFFIIALAEVLLGTKVEFSSLKQLPVRIVRLLAGVCGRLIIKLSRLVVLLPRVLPGYMLRSGMRVGVMVAVSLLFFGANLLLQSVEFLLLLFVSPSWALSLFSIINTVLFVLSGFALMLLFGCVLEFVHTIYRFSANVLSDLRSSMHAPRKR